MTAIRERMASRPRTTSWPSTVARPAVGRRAVARIRSSVVFPAPLGPSRARASPDPMPTSTPSSASAAPYALVRPEASITRSLPHEVHLERPLPGAVQFGHDNALPATQKHLPPRHRHRHRLVQEGAAEVGIGVPPFTIRETGIVVAVTAPRGHQPADEGLQILD